MKNQALRTYIYKGRYLNQKINHNRFLERSKSKTGFQNEDKLLLLKKKWLV
jgi:hypothetical protein